MKILMLILLIAFITPMIMLVIAVHLLLKAEWEQDKVEEEYYNKHKQ